LILVEEEMRRSLAFCSWWAQWWIARASNQMGNAAHVAEGQLAYAMEQKNAEDQRAIRWAAKWCAVRERARTVVQTHMSNGNAAESLPELVVELEEEAEDVEDT
jgi:HAMP domain-containing protein